MGQMASYFEGNILSTIKFDLAKKAVLVTAAQLADIDQQEEVEGVRSIGVDTDASALSTLSENTTTTMSSTTHSNASSIPVSAASISSTAVAVTKHSESISSPDYGLLTVSVMILCSQTVLAINIE
uniref:Uncharacterized protein n=1 Tax=Plectus sambesii TaxID=2011161 RepID=A0A914VQZ3_9BILA